MSQTELALRILFAAACGLILGLERELGGHPAGVRTHMLVAAGACLFTVAGGYGFSDSPGVPGDPTRIAAQVASGLGFLGAGTILRSGSSIRGLTTAATIWIGGALGVAIGAGAYLPTAVCLAVVLVALVGLGAARPLIRRAASTTVEMRLTYERGLGTIGPLIRGLAALDGRIDHIEVDDTSAGLRRVFVQFQVRERQRLHELTRALEERPEVREVSVS